MEKYDDLNLIALEVMMLEYAETDDYLVESVGARMANFADKLLDDLKKLIGIMVKYVKDIKTDIVVLASKTTMKAKLNMLKLKAKKGESISIPDFKKIESVYTNACNVLPKRLKKLLKAAYPIQTSADLSKFEERKIKFEKSLSEVESNLEEIAASTTTYSAQDAYNILNRLLHGDAIFVNTYYKAIREFEQFKNEYERILKETCRKNDGLGKKSLTIHKSLVAKTSTSLSRMLKKSIFLVSAMAV